MKDVDSADVVHPMDMTPGSDVGEVPAEINFETTEENFDYMMRAVIAKPKIREATQHVIL